MTTAKHSYQRRLFLALGLLFIKLAMRNARVTPAMLQLAGNAIKFVDFGVVPKSFAVKLVEEFNTRVDTELDQEFEDLANDLFNAKPEDVK